MVPFSLEWGRGEEERARVGEGTWLFAELLDGESVAETEGADPMDRLGGSGRGEDPKERRWEERRDMARWKGSANDELGGLYSFSFSLSASDRCFFSLPFKVDMSIVECRTVGEDDGEPDGNQMFV